MVCNLFRHPGICGCDCLRLSFNSNLNTDNTGEVYLAYNCALSLILLQLTKANQNLLSENGTK